MYIFCLGIVLIIWFDLKFMDLTFAVKLTLYVNKQLPFIQKNNIVWVEEVKKHLELIKLTINLTTMVR